jgi:NTP pyrophosphatase (non-canonical NTP hydrolase)
MPAKMPAKKLTLAELTAMSLKFRDQRNWAQFHTPKDLAANLCIEAAELLEVTQRPSGDELKKHLASPQGREAFEDELSDVMLTVLLLAHDQKIDLPAAFTRKMKKNKAKYPVGKARGNNAKYDKL